MKVAIIGGGLAGCAAAYALKQSGHECVIYEAGDQLASGASGNSIGLYNPRFGAEWTPQSEYYALAFERALDVFARFDNVEFNPCGALHFINDDKKRVRFKKMLSSWKKLHSMRFVSKLEASTIAGIDIDYDALYLPDSGSVHPAHLCRAYAQNVNVHYNHGVENLRDVDCDVYILAAGASLRELDIVKHLDLRAVRGQVSLLRADAHRADLKCHLCYGGYVSKAVNGVHMVGATFQRWLDHDEIMAADDVDNIEKLYAAVPTFPKGLEVMQSWAGVRATAKDHFPVVGHLRDNVYISTAHGSHGILSSLMAGEILASMIDNKPQTLSDDVLSALSPARFSH